MDRTDYYKALNTINIELNQLYTQFNKLITQQNITKFDFDEAYNFSMGFSYDDPDYNGDYISYCKDKYLKNYSSKIIKKMFNLYNQIEQMNNVFNILLDLTTYDQYEEDKNKQFFNPLQFVSEELLQFLDTYMYTKKINKEYKNYKITTTLKRKEFYVEHDNRMPLAIVEDWLTHNLYFGMNSWSIVNLDDVKNGCPDYILSIDNYNNKKTKIYKLHIEEI